MADCAGLVSAQADVWCTHVTSERWQQVKKVLAEALEQKPEGRRDYLDQACADPSLRREVESLIAAHEQGDSSFMERPVVVSPSSEALKSGSRLGNYEILARIGAGGMGVVYSARDTTLGRTVAIKVLPNAFLNDSERLARFQREARVLASLNHPNISTVHGLEQSGSTRALVMELVEGPTLADRIRQGPIPIEEALRIAKQICEALEYAHEHGVVHRDLKPANVKMTSEDAVKVLDFGLAKAIQGDGSEMDPANSPTISAMATQAGALLGTAAYMSPEQAKGKAVDRRADIWAFGCVLYEMLTRKMAFSEETVTDTLAAVIRAEPDWTPLPQATPIRVRVLLQRCLQKDPKQRLQAIGDARIVLEEVLSGAPEAATGLVVPQPSWHRVMPWTVAAVLTVALATTLWVSWRQRPIEAPVNQFVLLPPEKAAFGPNGGQPAISPDGRQIVFTVTDARGALLWLRPLDSLDPRPLAGTTDAELPFWSPDSRSVAFFAHGKLLRMDLHGGPLQTIAENASIPLGGAWSRDGVIAFTPRIGGLYRVLASGGEGKLISQAGHVEMFPSFLPDGRHFLFARSTAPTQADEYVGSLDSNDAKLILPGAQTAAYAPPGNLLFLRGGTLMAQPFDLGALSVSGDPAAIADGVEDFSVSDAGTLVYVRGSTAMNRLVWVDRAGKQISEAAPPGEYDNMQLSPDGKLVAFDGTNSGNLSIWIRDLERGIQSRLTFQPSNVPQWSPDGSTLVFAWLASGGVIDLGERPANMSEAEKVLVKLSAPPIMFPSGWTSDGRYLVYYRTDTNSKIQLWVLPMFGDRKPFPFLHSAFNESQGQVSPDGKWITYVSDESGAPQICVTSFPTPSGIQQISTAGGSQPRWRRDGKEMFYLAPNDQLMALTVRASETFEAGSPRALFETRLAVSELRQAYSVAPDGQRFLLAVPTETASPAMTLVQNWPSLLKK
jgi:eukaryotic-like serine/threonine-protein kinase